MSPEQLAERKKNLKIFIFDSYLGMQFGYNILKQMSMLKVDGNEVKDGKNTTEAMNELVNRIWKNIWYDEVGNHVRRDYKNCITQEVEATIFKTIGRNTYAPCGQQGWDTVRIILEQSMRNQIWYGIFGGMGKYLTEISESLNTPSSSTSSSTKPRDVKEATIWKYVFEALVRTLGQNIQTSIRGAINSSVGTGIKSHNDSIKKVSDKKGEKTNKEIKLETVDHFIGLGNWSGWLGFFDYFIRIGVIPSKTREDMEQIENFMKFKDLLRKGIWTMALFDDVCLVCRLPLKTTRDEQNSGGAAAATAVVGTRLHNVDGAPAVQWRDGSGQFFIRGVNFSLKLDEHLGQPPELYQKIINNTITFPEILAIDNMEQRRVALLEYGGSVRMLKETNAKLVDESKRGNKLYEVDPKMFAKLVEGSNINSERLRITTAPVMKYLYYKDTSTNREYVKPVHPSCKGADEAQAWSFQMTTEEYDTLEVET
jgi:hypothetical protein